MPLDLQYFGCRSNVLDSTRSLYHNWEGKTGNWKLDAWITNFCLFKFSMRQNGILSCPFDYLRLSLMLLLWVKKTVRVIRVKNLVTRGFELRWKCVVVGFPEIALKAQSRKILRDLSEFPDAVISLSFTTVAANLLLKFFIEKGSSSSNSSIWNWTVREEFQIH